MTFVPSTGGGGSGTGSQQTITQANTFTGGERVYLNSSGVYVLAQANSVTTSDVVGVVAFTPAPTVTGFTLITSGLVSGYPAATFSIIGGAIFLSDSVAGGATQTELTSATSIRVVLGEAISATSILLNIQDGTPVAGQTAVNNSTSNTGITDGQTTASTTFVDVAGGSIVLPVAGTYSVSYNLAHTNTGATNFNTFAITDNANAIVTGSVTQSRISTATGIQFGTGQALITVTGATTYKLRWLVSTGSGTIANTSAGGGNTGASSILIQQIGGGPVPMSLAGEYGSASLGADVSVVSTSFLDLGLSVTLPSAGTYLVHYDATVQNTTSVTYLQITDNSGTLVAGTFMGATQGTNVRAGISASAFVTVTSSAIYKLQTKVNSGTGTVFGTSGNQANTVMSFTKVSGFRPTTGSTVDYVNVRLSTNSTVGVGTPILFDVNDGGNIPYVPATGLFSLTGGKTYELTVGAYSGGSQVVIQWQTAAGVAIPSSGEIFTPAGSPGAYTVIYTPVSNVSIKAVSTATSPLLSGNRTLATIRQLGSTATTTTTLSRAFLTNATAFSVPNNVNTLVNTGWTVVNDATGSATASGVFTCPRTAYYQVSACLVFASTTATASTSFQVILAKNGLTVVRSLQQSEDSLTTTVRPTGTVSTIVSCTAGDTLTVFAFQNKGAISALDAVNIDNYFSIAELTNSN